ncbi:hypothetical protein [Sulfitobacter sp.]|uniref:hypothetical protein n=1 Tax=Sulfitobacter sp. TaxID=1903071 RepID=UPI003F6B03CA
MLDELEGLLDHIVETSNPSVIAAYEKKIIKLETEKQILANELDQKVKPNYTFEPMSELSMTFTSSLWNI